MVLSIACREEGVGGEECLDDRWSECCGRDYFVLPDDGSREGGGNTFFSFSAMNVTL